MGQFKNTPSAYFQTDPLPIATFLCATSAFSVPLWLRLLRENNHRDTEDTEVAQRNQTSGKAR